MNKLAEQFEAETETPAINSQGEPDIDYVAWLEAKVQQAQKPEPEVSEVLRGFLKWFDSPEKLIDHEELIRQYESER